VEEKKRRGRGGRGGGGRKMFMKAQFGSAHL
jgi:hypothetical protein